MTPPLLPQSGSQTALPVNTMSTALSTGTDTQQYGSMSQYNQSLDNAAMQQSQQQMYSESGGQGGALLEKEWNPWQQILCWAEDFLFFKIDLIILCINITKNE